MAAALKGDGVDGVAQNDHQEPDALAAARKHFQEEGWAIVPDVLSSEEADTVVDRLWMAKEAGEKRGDDTFMPTLDPNASNVRVFYLLELDKIFRDLINHPTAVSMVKAVLGDDYLISNFTANIARPGSQSMALHSDQSIVVPEPWHHTWALNIIWCLSDVYRENGATLFIPGSNKWTSRSQIPVNAPSMLRPFEAKKVSKAPAESKAIQTAFFMAESSLITAADIASVSIQGSIIAMDARIWHTSGANTTLDVDRPLLFGYYSAPFLRQQVNWTAKLPQEIQSELSEELQQRLGLGATANTGRTGDLRYMSVQYPEAKA